MSKRTRAAIIVSTAAIVLLALGYFVALPQMQTSDYVATVKDKQLALREQMQRLVELLDRDTFTKSEPELTTIRSDIKASQDVLADVKSQLDISGGKLVDFTEYPLLSWHPTYKAAIDLRASEKSYIDQADMVTTEMEEVIVYYDKFADVKAKTDILEMEAENMGTIEYTPEGLIAALEKIKKGLTGAFEQAKDITPPASLEESHDYMVASSKKMLNLYDQMVAALKAEQYEKMPSIDTKMQAAEKELAKKQDGFTKKFLNESALRQYIDKMLDADRDIKKHLG